MKSIQDIINRVIDNEGGYVNHPNDPGGETKFGISKRAYPTVDIKNLTKEKAADIYFKDYWKAWYLECNNDFNLAYKIMDLVVNMGPKQANKCLQRALLSCGHKVEDDGVIGNVSKDFLKKTNSREVLAALKSEAAGFYRALAASDEKFKVFLNGWLTRAYKG